MLYDVDEEQEVWHHLYVDAITWRHGVLDDLLLLVADWKVADVVIAPMGFKWLYHPYDGGGDILASNTDKRDRIRDSHPDWLSKHPEGY